MAILVLPDELQSVVESEVRDNGYSDAAAYVSSLIRKDQERRANAEMEAVVLAAVESGDVIEMDAQSWRDLRLELHRQAGIA